MHRLSPEPQRGPLAPRAPGADGVHMLDGIAGPASPGGARLSIIEDCQRPTNLPSRGRVRSGWQAQPRSMELRSTRRGDRLHRPLTGNCTPLPPGRQHGPAPAFGCFQTRNPRRSAERCPSCPRPILRHRGATLDTLARSATRPHRGNAPTIYVMSPHDILRPFPATSMTFDVDIGAGRDVAMHAANTLRRTCAVCA
jgi:hypothetical protein